MITEQKNPAYSIIAHRAMVDNDAAWEAHIDAMLEPTDPEARQHARTLAAKAGKSCDLLSRTAKYL